METIAYEMATHVSLTATTPILNQSNERNATILDATGCLAALSVGIPQFMLSSTLPVRFALDFFGRDGLHDGDVLVANDPYHGGGHLPDYNVFAPVFHDGELVLIASIQCHHADTGGGMPGGYNADAPDIWAEGVRFPAVKMIERGVERKDVTYLMRVNNRTPTFLGDLRAQIGAAQLGARRLKEVLARFGAGAVRGAVQFMIELAARRFRETVAGWPDGVYESDVYVDHDPKGNPDIHLHCKVTVAGERLTIDFSGSDARPEIQAYSSFGNTRGYVVAQLASMMDPAIPKNEGFFQSIELIVPEGCCLNPPPGRSVAAGTHHPGTEVGEAIAKALEQIVPELCCPQIYKIGMPTVIYGKDPLTGRLFIDNSADTIAAHASAAFGQDGWGSMNASFGNLIRATAEINESIFPQRQLARDYETDSGGAGKWRGGLGTLYVKQLLVPASVYTYVVGRKYPMPGIAGGRPGAPNRLVLKVGGAEEEAGRTTRIVDHAAGEAIAYHYGGGGGWGDPLERDPAKVLDDVLDEYVSMRSAREDYGVVLTGSLQDLDLQVDVQATALLREAMRASSQGRE
jgi:N-methylhydantoinase B